MQWTAYDLLWQRSDETAKQELLKYSPLHSEVGIDYTRLRDLLIAEKWEEADGETKRVMLKASGREKEGMLDRFSIEKFPSQDLLTLAHTKLHSKIADFSPPLPAPCSPAVPKLPRLNATSYQLWRRDSKERFGFSVQKHIWQSISPNQNLDWWKKGVGG